MEPLERIFELADKKFPDQQGFAKALGVYPSMVSAWRKGKSESYVKRIPQIARVLNTTVGYLLGEDEKTDGIGDGGLTAHEQDILAAYRQADERARQVVDLTLSPWIPPARSDKAM